MEALGTWGILVLKGAAMLGDRPRLKVVFFVAAGLALLAGVTVGVLIYAQLSSRRLFRHAQESFELDVHRDLPVGSPEDQVRGFLDRRGLAYAEINERNDGPYLSASRNSDSWYTDTFKVIQGHTSYISAPRFLCRISFEFKFDKQEKLLGYRDQLTCKEALF